MKQFMHSICRIISCFMLFTISVPPAFASAPAGEIGPYHVELKTNPPVIAVGNIKLTINVTDSSGKPVDGATVRALVQMPGMPMGEKETVAAPVNGAPGSYQTNTNISMEGGFNASISITGPQGNGNGVIQLQTGQDTTAGGKAGISPTLIILLIIGVCFLLFVIYRMRKTGQHVSIGQVINLQTILGLIILGVIFLISMYAIQHWRRQGAMTPLAAQGMQMETPAPPGYAAVTLARVIRAPMQSTVNYTGQAVSYNEQQVQPRVSGWINWMPYYVGDHVRSGQLLAKLDTSQQSPVVEQQRAGLAMAEQGVEIAKREYQQAQVMKNQTQAELKSKRNAVSAARANADAARQDIASANANLTAFQTQVVSANAGLQSARANQDYWTQEIAREKMLLDRGAVPVEEYQREKASAADAEAKTKQAEAAVKQAQAQALAARAAVSKSQAMLEAAIHQAEQAASDVQASADAVRSAQAATETAYQKIAQSRAGTNQAAGALTSAMTEERYSEIKAPGDGIITRRLLSPGQLVNPGQTIFTVDQIRPIRLQANVAQSDLQHIKLGDSVNIHEPGGSGRIISARITSITPSVDPSARTGIVEAVYPNLREKFLPGAYVSMDISLHKAHNALHIPTAAIHIQSDASQGVLSQRSSNWVWAASPINGQPGQYTVHKTDVQIGISDSRDTEIVSGLSEGQQVVLVGGDFLKEGDTVNAPESPQGSGPGSSTFPAPAPKSPPASMPGMPGMAPIPAAKPANSPAKMDMTANTATVNVSIAGFQPDNVMLKAGIPARLIFIRKDNQTCAKEILIPDYHLRKTLPLNTPVTFEFTPRKGQFTFQCGMNMLHGAGVAQ
jgi:RND family efflux transporter MFP subunit